MSDKIVSDNKNELFRSAVDSLMDGMGGLLSTKTVVGEAIHIGDIIILPLVDVSFGMGAGSFSSENKNNSGGGLGGKMSPSAVLVIQGGSTKLINVRETDGISKLIDLVPEILDKILPNINKSSSGRKMDPEARAEAEKAVADAISPDIDEVEVVSPEEA